MYGSVCLVCCVSEGVCELFGETIRNMFGCCLPKSMGGVLVITVCV